MEYKGSALVRENVNTTVADVPEEWGNGIVERTRFQCSRQINEVAAALARAQAKMAPAKRGSANPFFHSTYANLGSVMEACMPALNAEELCVVQTPVPRGRHEVEWTVPVREDGVERQEKRSKFVMKVGLACRLIHSSGQWLESYGEADAADTSPQAVGSTYTYLRRYVLSALVGVATEDDDGNAGSGRNDAARPATKRRRQAAADKKELDKDVMAKRDALRKAILDHCEGDAKEAKSILKDCTSGKNFEGFSSVMGIQQGWQIEQAIERFEKLTGDKVETKQS